MRHNALGCEPLGSLHRRTFEGWSAAENAGLGGIAMGSNMSPAIGSLMVRVRERATGEATTAPSEGASGGESAEDPWCAEGGDPWAKAASADAAK